MEFFVSYHGYNPCDLGASHIKRKLDLHINDNNKELEVSEIVSIGNTPSSHKATLFHSH
jgi:hypothetical protein